MTGRLVMCATPIGNLSDVTPRLRDELAAADVVYAEDTRRTRKLLSALGVQASLRSLFVGNEAARSEELRQRLSRGATVAVVTDAGVPGISDPGARAVATAAEVGAQITVVPGPSAVTAAVSLSGFDGDRFVFEGFLPRRGRERAQRLASLAAETRTTVLFLSPHRAGQDLADLAGSLGEGREVVVARELTKLHEEVWRGALGEAVERWADDAKGEFTIVLRGAPAPVADIDAAVTVATKAIEDGESPSDAVRRVAAELGVSRRRLYDRVVGTPP